MRTHEQIAELRRLLKERTPGTFDTGATTTGPDEPHDWFFARGPMIKGLPYEQAKAQAVKDAACANALRNNADAMLDDLDRLEAENERLRAELQGMTAMRDEAMKQHADDVRLRTETERNQRVLDAAEFAKLIAENTQLRLELRALAQERDNAVLDAKLMRDGTESLLARVANAEQALDAIVADAARLQGLVDGFMAATEWANDWPDPNTAGYAAIREMRKKVTG